MILCHNLYWEIAEYLPLSELLKARISKGVHRVII